MSKVSTGWALGLLWVAAPWCLSSGAGLGLLAQIGIAATVLMSYHLLLGQGGLLSFGHAVYVGAGAYAVAHAMAWGVSGAWGVALVPLFGGLVAGALALLTGWVSTRHAAMPFAMITLGVGELVWALSHMLPAWFGGEGGLGLDRAVGAETGAWSWGPVQHITGLISVYTVLCVGLMVAWTTTPMGRLLKAVRDNPLRAASVGVNPHRIRHAAFVVSATFAGVAGGLAALWFERVSPEVFSTHRSGAYLLFAFIGGATVLAGPLLGAVLMVVALVVGSSWTPAWLLYLGVLFVVLLLVEPGGLAGALMRGWRWAMAARVPNGGHEWLCVARRTACGLSWVVVIVAAVVGVEMLYFWQLSSSQGTLMTWWPEHAWAWSVDVAAPRSWWALLAVPAVSGLLGWRLRPQREVSA
ncbi:LivM ABC-type branched-chain amino acid transport system, permease component [Burkholderiaceae bacterium]